MSSVSANPKTSHLDITTWTSPMAWIGATVADVRRCLAAGADVHALDEDGDTPLHNAAFWGSPEMAQVLIDAGAKVDARNLRQETPLCEAAKRGNLKLMDVLLAANADIFARCQDNRTLLHFAAMNFGTLDNSEVIAKLLRSGIPVNACDISDMTPLHYAASTGSIEMVEALLDAGADPAALTSLQNTPLHLAVGDEYNLIIVNRLLEVVTDINAPDLDGNTPLHIAAERGATDVVEALLKADANVNATNAVGATPLHLAALANNLELVELLLAHDADIGARDKHEDTPLHYTDRFSVDDEVLNALTAAWDARETKARDPDQSPTVDR